MHIISKLSVLNLRRYINEKYEKQPDFSATYQKITKMIHYTLNSVNFKFEKVVLFLIFLSRFF